MVWFVSLNPVLVSHIKIQDSCSHLCIPVHIFELDNFNSQQRAIFHFSVWLCLCQRRSLLKIGLPLFAQANWIFLFFTICRSLGYSCVSSQCVFNNKHIWPCRNIKVNLLIWCWNSPKSLKATTQLEGISKSICCTQTFLSETSKSLQQEGIIYQTNLFCCLVLSQEWNKKVVQKQLLPSPEFPLFNFSQTVWHIFPFVSLPFFCFYPVVTIQ